VSAKKTENSHPPSIAGESFQENSTKELYLSSISPSDKPWDKHRKLADLVGPQYAGSKFESYAERINFCSQTLGFGWKELDDGLKLKLKTAKFCRVRHCPICQWRRSLMWKAKAHQILPKIVSCYPTHRWLFMTLTVKNCPIVDLRDTLTEMNGGFGRLVKRKLFPALGWLKSMEVTRGENGDAHPHFHCLLMVPASYFDRGYIRQSKWVELWRDCMRLDYDPVVDIRAMRISTTPSTLVSELIKYCVKESDLTADREWFLELTQQLHKMRAIATGGVLKEYLRDLEREPEDLIGGSEDEEKKITSDYFLDGERTKKDTSK
jgi:plasmid rolling circle replication initiator protein Rep